MGEVFVKLLNMSITAGWLILAVLLVRIILKKAPRWIICLFWGLVAVRLICPVSIESMLSLIPSEETVKTVSVINGERQPYIPSIDSEIPMVRDTINPRLQENFSYDKSDSVAPLQVYTFVVGVIWCGGMLLLLTYAVISQIRIRYMVREAVPYTKNIYICDAVKSPFILGFARPRIYISSNVKKEELPYVIAHEKAHLRRKDHWWKPIAYVLLAVYWFHPLCWVAYILFCKDMEIACDESVIRDMAFEQKKEYSKALLSCSMKKKMVLAYPLAFGEVSVKERIQSVLRYKKASVWAIGLAVLICVVVAVCFLTNPPTKDEDIDTMEMNEESGEQSEVDGNLEESEADMTEDGTDNSEAVEEIVTQSGAKGTMSITIPSDWEYELCPENSGKLINGEYGIKIYPMGVEVGYISIASVDGFGVCGMGLAEEAVNLAGDVANKGTFDGHAYWDFVAFHGKNEGIVAQTYEVESWWSEYEKQVWDILDTLQFSMTENESASEIQYITLINGDTGEELSYSKLGSTDIFQELLRLYGQLDFGNRAENNTRIGYRYSMVLYDPAGEIIHRITPYKDGFVFDTDFYKYESPLGMDEASVELMNYIDLLFYPTEKTSHRKAELSEVDTKEHENKIRDTLGFLQQDSISICQYV